MIRNYTVDILTLCYKITDFLLQMLDFLFEEIDCTLVNELGCYVGLTVHRYFSTKRSLFTRVFKTKSTYETFVLFPFCSQM